MSKSIKLRLVLWFYNTFQQVDLRQMTPKKFRQFSDHYKDDRNLLDEPTIPIFKVENRMIAGRDCPLPIRIFRPNDTPNLPVIVFFHGGGFVMGTLDTHDNVCRRLSRDNQAIVVSVDYRLAPENPFPAAPNDCYDATVWVANNCDSLGGDASRLVVMGDSAGGNLATVVSLMSRDFNGPKIAFQVLVYPCTDARLNHPSMSKHGKGHFLTEEMVHWFLRHYLPEGTEKAAPYVSPYLAEDLTNLPPALIQVAEFDPLRDEGAAYAERLLEAGNKVIFTEYKGAVHSYFTMPKLLKQGRAAYIEIKKVLTGVLQAG